MRSLTAHLASLRAHGAWADQRLLDGLRAAGTPVPDALRELAHVRGAQEVWLSRIEQRPATIPVWPALSLDELAEIGHHVDQAWERFFEACSDATLDRLVAYTNSAGAAFTTPLDAILFHVMTHGQYHRGKANVALRAAGAAAVGVDYIVWVRSGGLNALRHES
jgi:uncharacterized damage-inducible protein DinB